MTLFRTNWTLIILLFLGVTVSSAQSSIVDITTYSDVVTDSDNSVGSGDVIVFTTTVKNISNINISNFTITNTLFGIDGTALALGSPITFVGNSDSSSPGSLIAGETSTYVSTYTIDTAGVNAGGISFTVTGTGSTPGNSNNVVDVSNDGDDSDGNLIDDPTQVIIGNTVTLVEGTKLENYIYNDSNGSIGL